jgi:hypothetical protein
VTEGERYDWWAAEGRPERLRPLKELAERVAQDADLEAFGITVFSSGVDFEREIVEAEVAAPNAAEARDIVRERYGGEVEIDVVAPAAFVVEDISWESWTRGRGESELSVWLLDHTDGSELHCEVSETERDVVITLRGPRWQGAHSTIGIEVEKPVRLTAPLAGRSVIDGSTGHRRPERGLA